ncbi:class I SAM-dependent methyltransferase [Panacibacter ginsenosidivorans]|uniref:class I SAM-dependent methyltransferase n=1 Tax=Panacibacter ginsenosidivorans TaxID=1813871 RepID=UPI0013150CD7|nr:class I SAM-dependent methyltransferase [Panacibacter ginsenosidivorans]
MRKGDKIQIPGSYQHDALYEGNFVQRSWHRLKYKEALKVAKPLNGDVILDVGCGSGVLSNMLAEQYGATVTGIDGNVEAIKFCKEQYHLENLSFKYMIFEDIATHFHDNTIDKIFFLETIEHITKAQAENLMNIFYRILKPGGTLIITTPNKFSFWPLTEFILDRFKLVPDLGEGQHEHIYSSKELRALVVSSGFTKIFSEKLLLFAPWLSFMGKKFTDVLHRLESNDLLPGSLLLHVYRK